MTTLARAPRTTTGRYPRGEETKQRIIDVAVDIFGRQGFAGTSTRDIAAAAAVNTPAIQYYFDGKAGLYNACVDRLTCQAQARIAPAVHACNAVIDARAPQDAIVDALAEVQSCMIDAFFADDEGRAIRRLLAWEDAEDDNHTSGQFMKERLALPIFETFRRAVQHVVPSRMSMPEIQMHALSLMGLTMIFHINQSRVLDMMSWSMCDDGTLERLKKVAHAHLAYALSGLAQAETTSRPATP